MTRAACSILIAGALWLDWRLCLPDRVQWTLPPYDPNFPEARILRSCRSGASAPESAVLILPTLQTRVLANASALPGRFHASAQPSKRTRTIQREERKAA